MSLRPPLIGLPCCFNQTEEQPFHIVGNKYVTAVLEGAGAMPVLIPALGDDLPVEDLLDRLDGLLLTGSPSNIEPHHYNGPLAPDGNLIDPVRDATTLPLIRAAIDRGIPILGICRGLQELNVALGGTLYQEVHKVPGRADHRSDHSGTWDNRYRPAHPVTLVAGGMCATIAGETALMVNSLHGQGIEHLAPELTIDATAPDGQIEAVRLDGAAFVLAVQWHPEWKLRNNPFAIQLFGAFGQACRRYAAARDAG